MIVQMRTILRTVRTLIAHPLVHMNQKKKIALAIAAKIASASLYEIAPHWMAKVTISAMENQTIT